MEALTCDAEPLTLQLYHEHRFCRQTISCLIVVPPAHLPSYSNPAQQGPVVGERGEDEGGSGGCEQLHI